MLPLIPLVLSLAPEIGKWLFGSKGEAIAGAVAQVVQTVTGTDDAAAASAVVARDPDKAAALRLELAKIAAQAEQAARQADLDTFRAQLADVASARGQTVDLAKAGSSVAWGAPVISAVVLVTFATVMFLALTRSLPAGSETILNMMLGTLAAMATAVVSYWVGSSAGSTRKDELLHQSTPTG